MRAPTPIQTLPRLTPPPTTGAEAGAASNHQLAAPTDTTAGCAADHDDLVEALAAYDAQRGRGENAYATLTAAARRCGCPAGELVITFARRRVETWRRITGQADAEVAAAKADFTRLELVTAEPRQWAVGSENGAA